MNTYDRAKAWLDKQDAAISGSGGHNQTFHVAVCLVQGFQLGMFDAGALLAEYNRRCQPPWSDRELKHKLESAALAKTQSPPGFMLRGEEPTQRFSYSRRPVQTKKTPRLPAVKTEGVKLPEPMKDGARALLKAVFKPTEGVRIAGARLNAEDREVPADEGPCLPLEEWIKKLDAKKGDANGLWWSTKRTGIYISINPMRVGGSKDSDVTAFRHALVEFDNVSREAQWALYEQTRLPCAAIISSGGKSIHAWVKVDAKDRKEYDERVRQLYEHFEESGYPLDTKNKNPSRFSRLPNCVRFKARQELLALNTGCETFTDWLIEQSNRELPEERNPSYFSKLDPYHDPSCVIGFDNETKATRRYLCKGKAAWLIGPSGIGKSTLLTAFAFGWAKGEAVFGIRPVRPLKSLIVQAENDEMDLAEMLRGISQSHGITFGDDGAESFGTAEDQIKEIDSRVAFVTETRCVGDEFLDRLKRMIERGRPDVVWVDPLLSFAGIDVARQTDVTKFLRQGLNPILEETGAVCIGLHHTGKPKQQMRNALPPSPIEHAYSGIGSSELVNWARAVMVLVPHGDGNFELKLAKRGPRAGARHPTKGWAWDSVWIKHAAKTVLWEQIDPPEEPAEAPRSPKAPREKPPSTAESFFQSIVNGPCPTLWERVKGEIPEAGQPRTTLAKWLHGHGVSIGESISDRTIRDKVIPILIKENYLSYDPKEEVCKRKR